jgi:hypothetical protein
MGVKEEGLYDTASAAGAVEEATYDMAAGQNGSSASEEATYAMAAAGSEHEPTYAIAASKGLATDSSSTSVVCDGEEATYDVAAESSSIGTSTDTGTGTSTGTGTGKDGFHSGLGNADLSYGEDTYDAATTVAQVPAGSHLVSSPPPLSSSTSSKKLKKRPSGFSKLFGRK